jgi:hypothetical protein
MLIFVVGFQSSSEVLNHAMVTSFGSEGSHNDFEH